MGSLGEWNKIESEKTDENIYTHNEDNDDDDNDG